MRFLANVDPVDVARAIDGLDPEETLVIVVSKTFTTAETMLNARTLKDWLLTTMKGKAAPESITKQHIVAVSTSIEKCVDFGVDSDNIFGFWDWVGGRFSVCSAVGIFPLSLHYGYEQVGQIFWSHLGETWASVYHLLLASLHADEVLPRGRS
jgi:glucose-6-phosphate isomerase